jgi:Protein of unknown function (DUF3237)
MKLKTTKMLMGLVTSMLSSVAFSGGPSTDIKTEYLMTLTAQLDAAQVINSNLFIYNVPSGAVEGPKIKGKILPPAADWLALLPSGVLRLDVRLTILTDDNQYIYMTYNGVIKTNPATDKKFAEGKEVIKTEEQYFITAPTFQTASPKYAWLNEIQCAGKQIALKGGDGSYIRYDIFALR